jgi:hypothetical protein
LRMSGGEEWSGGLSAFLVLVEQRGAENGKQQKGKRKSRSVSSACACRFLRPLLRKVGSARGTRGAYSGRSRTAVLLLDSVFAPVLSTAPSESLETARAGFEPLFDIHSTSSACPVQPLPLPIFINPPTLSSQKMVASPSIELESFPTAPSSISSFRPSPSFVERGERDESPAWRMRGLNLTGEGGLQLLPVDRGKGAWGFVAAAFILECVSLPFRFFSVHPFFRVADPPRSRRTFMCVPTPYSMTSGDARLT